MSSTFNRTLTVSNTVGELKKVVTLSTTNPDITFEELASVAHLVLNNDEVTKVEGVKIRLNIVGPEEELQPKTDPFAEVLMGVFGYSPTAAEREQREFEETKKFNDEFERRTSEMFCPALEWYLAKVACVVKNDEGWAHVQKTGAREIAKGWAHVQMLQEHIRKLEKNNVEGVELINRYKAQINELQQLMGKRAEEHEAQIRELHGTSVELTRAFDRERAALRDENMSLVNRIKVANKLIGEICRVL